MPMYSLLCDCVTMLSCVPPGQHGGVAFTPVAPPPPSRQRSRGIVRQHSSDSIIGSNTIRTVISPL